MPRLAHLWRGSGTALRTALRASQRARARPFTAAAASGVLCGGALLAARAALEVECKGAERRAEYVVIGGASSAMGGVHGVRQVDASGSVIVVSPYPSPSFAVTGGCSGADGLCVEFSALEPSDLKNVTFEKTSAVGLDADSQMVTLSDGSCVHYAKGCLIASENEVAAEQLKPLNRAIADSAMPYVRMMGDPGTMQEVVTTVEKAHSRGEQWHVTVLGGTAEACVLSSALVARGAVVTQVCEEKSIMGNAIPHYLGTHIMWLMKRMGVEVLPYSHMQYCRVVQEASEDAAINPTNSEYFEVFVRKSYDRLDVRKHTTNMLVVFPARTGRSNNLISDANGLEAASDGGYLVNAELCARSKVYVAGPSANIRHALFGRMHVEGEEDSWTSGVCAGRNMAGDRSQYTHVVSNNSNICIFI